MSGHLHKHCVKLIRGLAVCANNYCSHIALVWDHPLKRRPDLGLHGVAPKQVPYNLAQTLQEQSTYICVP